MYKPIWVSSKLIFIHGISSSGKSTIGKLLEKVLGLSHWIDQDTFYFSDKPKVSFDNKDVNSTTCTQEEKKTYTGSNWDCIEAIDFDALRYSIIASLCRYEYVIVTGFALRQKELNLIADYSFVLSFDFGNGDDIIDLETFVTETRKISKKITDIDKQEKDYWMVRKVVYPFYLETLTKIQKSTKICVYRNQERVDVRIIVDDILSYVNKK
jgi:hypothetical protein